MHAKSESHPIWWLPLGIRPFADIWKLQSVLIKARLRREIPDLFISLEHPHVITTGRSAQSENLLSLEAPDGSGVVPIFNIERGGDVTYHGPGQLVGYFIFDMEAMGRDLHLFLRQVEQVQIELMKAFNLEGERVEGKTGVWMGERKLGSVGIAVRQWISYHGFALNVSTDLRFFELINPCGFEAGIMSSLSQANGSPISTRDVEPHIPAALESVFKRDVIRVSEKRLPPSVLVNALPS